MNKKFSLIITVAVVCSLFFNLTFACAENIPTIKIERITNLISFSVDICKDIYKRTGKKFIFERNPIGEGLFGRTYRIKGDVVDLCLKIFRKKTHTFQHNIYYNLSGEHFDPNFLKHIVDSKTPHLNFPVVGYESKKIYVTISKYNNAGTLKDLIESGQKLDQKQIATIIHDILTGLNCLHKANLVHGDMWSDNIMLENTEGKLRAFIIDFDFTGPNNNLLLIRNGFNKYDGPEHVLSNESISFKTEIFSVGIFLWELLYGEAPFGGLIFNKGSKIFKEDINYSHEQLINLHSKALAKLPTYLCEMEKDENLSIECRDLLSKLLNPNPDLRLSAEEALNHRFFNILN